MNKNSLHYLEHIIESVKGKVECIFSDIADDTRMSRFSENWTNHLEHPDNSKAFRNRRRNTDVEFEKALSRVSTV